MTTAGSPTECFSPQSTSSKIPGAEFFISRNIMLSNPTNTTTAVKKYCARCFSSSSSSSSESGDCGGGGRGGGLMRCSRCKVVQYCSRDCQRSHYKLIHRGGCQSLSDIRTKKKQQQQKQQNEETESGEAGSTTTSSNADDNESRHIDDSILTTIIDLTHQEANLIFQMAYRYSDNIERGRYMYDEACVVYLEALELEARRSENNNNDNNDDGTDYSSTSTMWLDHLRLLWVSLGHFDAFLGSLFPKMFPESTDGSDEFASSTICNNATADVVAELCEQNLWNKVKEMEEEEVDRNDGEDQRPKTKLTRAVQLGILLLKLQYISSLNDGDDDSDNSSILRPKKHHTKVQIIQKYNEQVEMVKTYLKESGIEMIEHLLDGGDEDCGIDSEDQQMMMMEKNSDVVLWMSFFNRSNVMGSARFGPEALGWKSSTTTTTTTTLSSSSPSSSDDVVTLPPFPDFYTFLQDICFWNAKINAVIGQILDGGDDDDSDEDDNNHNDDGRGGFDQAGQNGQGYYSLGGHLK